MNGTLPFKFVDWGHTMSQFFSSSLAATLMTAPGALDDAIVLKLAGVFLLLGIACLASVGRRRPGKAWVKDAPFLELMRHYGPGTILDYHARYGRECHPRCWSLKIPLDPRIIATVNADVVRHVLVDKFPNYEKGPQWRAAFDDLLGTGIFNADGHLWRKQRKVSSHEFSVKSMRDFMFDIFANHAREIVTLAGDAAGAVDAQELFAQYTLQSIGQIGFGVDLGALDGDRGAAVAADFGDAFNAATQLSGDRFVDPAWRVKRFLNVGSERRLRDAVRRVRKFSSDVIAQRRLCGRDDLRAKPDILSRFMAHEAAAAGAAGGGGDAPSEFTFTDEELHFAVINFVLAGRDTTANQMTWALYECCKRPDVVDEIRRESDALGRDASYASITKRAYLKAVLTETLRPAPAPESIARARAPPSETSPTKKRASQASTPRCPSTSRPPSRTTSCPTGRPSGPANASCSPPGAWAACPSTGTTPSTSGRRASSTPRRGGSPSPTPAACPPSSPARAPASARRSPTSPPPSSSPRSSTASTSPSRNATSPSTTRASRSGSRGPSS